MRRPSLCEKGLAQNVWREIESLSLLTDGGRALHRGASRRFSMRNAVWLAVVELECSDIKLHEKLDDSLFTPPAKEGSP